MELSTKSLPIAKERASDNQSPALEAVDEKTLCASTSTANATGKAHGYASVCPVPRAAHRGTASPVFMTSVEGEVGPHRYTLLTDALSSDDESCSEWQAMKAELSDWNISTKNKCSKKRKKRRKKKKGVQTASCPDRCDGEVVKLDPKQGQQNVKEPSPTVYRSRTVSAGSRSSGSYYDAETSPTSIQKVSAQDSEKTISPESSSSYYDAESPSFTDSCYVTFTKKNCSNSSQTPVTLKHTATETISEEIFVSESPVSDTEFSPLSNSCPTEPTQESSASNISPLSKSAPVSSSSNRPRIPLRRATTRLPLAIPLKTTPPQEMNSTTAELSKTPPSSFYATTRLPTLKTTPPQEMNSVTAALSKPETPPLSATTMPTLKTTPPQEVSSTTELPKIKISPVSLCPASDCAKTPLRRATVRGSPLPHPPQQNTSIKPSCASPSLSPCCGNHPSSSNGHSPAQLLSPDTQPDFDEVNEIAHFTALKRVCNNSSLRVPPILCHDIYPKCPPAPYKVSRNCPVPYPIRGVNIDACVPSKYICQEHISPVKEVLAKYSHLIKKGARLIHICKLCIKLAKEAIFGVSIMIMCSTSEKGFLFGLPFPELWLLKRIVLEQYTQYWNRLNDFEIVWKWCMKALRKTCRTERLRISEGCTEEDLYRLSCSCEHSS